MHDPSDFSINYAAISSLVMKTSGQQPTLRD